MENFTSGKLAKLANINIESIRFYEKKGLMPKPKRTNAGYRIYSLNDLQRIKFIKKAQKLGFSLNEIKELLNIKVDENFSCADIQQILKEKINDINYKINEMKKISVTLQEMQKLCSTNELEKECPFLNLLYSN